MVVGTPSLRSPPTDAENIVELASGQQAKTAFTCGRQNTNGPLYSAASPGKLIFPGSGTELHFPSCYDPSKAVSDFRNGNTAYPTVVNGKENCPPGWLHVPHLFLEQYWETGAFDSEWTPGQGTTPFVFSMGDPTGFGLHGDFVSLAPFPRPPGARLTSTRSAVGIRRRCRISSTIVTQATTVWNNVLLLKEA